MNLGECYNEPVVRKQRYFNEPVDWPDVTSGDLQLPLYLWYSMANATVFELECEFVLCLLFLM